MKTSEELTKLGKKVLGDINRKENPNIEIPIRALSNVIFDKKSGQLTLGNKTSKRYFFNVAHAKKFMQTMLVASFCKDIIDEKIHASIRDMFYNLKHTFPDSDENTFDFQTESDPIIVDLEVALDVLREQLHLTTDRKGIVAGNVIIQDRGDLIDWSKLGSGGWSIPSTVEEVELKKVDAEFVLCVPEFEKVVVKEDESLRISTLIELWRKYGDESKDLADVDIEVVSTDGRSCQLNKVTKISRRKSQENEKLIKITSKSGSVIHISENHLLPVFSGANLVNKRAKDITSDDILFESRDLSGIERHHSNEIDLIEFLINTNGGEIDKIFVLGDVHEELKETEKGSAWWFKRTGGLCKEHIQQWKKNGVIPLKFYLKFEKSTERRKHLRLFYKGAKHKNSIPAVILLNENFAKLLGYYVAEGHVYKKNTFLTFGRHERNYIKEVTKLIELIFGIRPKIYKDEGNYSSVQILAGNKVIGLLIESLCGTNSGSKKVPEILFNATNSSIKEFLSGYIAGDGYNDKGTMRCTTISDELAIGIRLLLKIIGVPSYLQFMKSRGKKFQIYEAKDQYIVDILYQHWEKERSHISHSLWDKAPLCFFTPTRELNYKKQYFGHMMANIYAYAQNYILNNAAIHPVEIRSIEVVEYDGHYYDFVSVEPSHVFMHASGIFTHNCVEKNAGFERLHEDKFWQKHKCILIGTGGQPSRGTRLLIQRLNQEHKLPVYVMTDADSYGWYIYSVIKSGSISLAHVSDRIATPEARFIGLSISDIYNYDLKKATIKAKEVDIARAKELLQYDWFKNPKWQKEINLMIEKGIKAEIEALSNRGLKFMSETYLPEKLKEKDFLD